MLSSKSTFPIVGIGASAGGLAPIEEFFDHMPANTGMAFVIVQHLSPDFKSLMDELLARHTDMAIHKVTDKIVVEPNSIYLIPPEKNMALSNGKLLLTDQEQTRGLNLPIDIFFSSLAKDAGVRSFAIVLSGTGTDGSRGIQDIRELGGAVLVQSLDTAGFDGMPRAAVQSGAVDSVLAPKEMPERILEYLKTHNRASLQKPHAEDKTGVAESAMFHIVRFFRLQYSVDFALYKPATITRRLKRRMQLVGVKQMTDYVRLIETNEEEADKLFRDLLVEVTQFFRDPEAFEKLRKDVIPNIIRNSKPDEEIRIWVPGCATGEEAYTLAILLQNAMDNLERTQDFKIFATDLHRTSLETASHASYPSQSLESVPDEFAKRYFTVSNGICHLKREVRQKVIFAESDLTSDPPFTRIDLISCRNVLIYLENKVQRRILALFHFGLKTGGTLFLGPSESVGELAPEFDTVDRHWRIYSKRRDVRLPEATRMPVAPVLDSIIRNKQPPLVASAMTGQRDNTVSTVTESLLSKYVPASLLINDLNELVHTFGDARKLLIQPEGTPTLDVLKMLTGELRSAVSAALHRARQEDTTVEFNGVRVNVGDDEFENYKVLVEPYGEEPRNHLLICLEKQQSELPTRDVVEDFDASEHSQERVGQLEKELTYTRETLQATVEELETSNEELQATNEELIASNEELQSTNEELHSVNEELYTVNSEHKQRIDELTELTEDMDNLLRSTDIGTMFLDREFRIRMFTPAISAAFDVIEQDIGRPIDHIAYKLDSPRLLKDAAQVLETRESKEIEVQGTDGRTYLQRIQPYRSADNNVEGIVLTTTEISALKEAEAAQRTLMTLAQINEELPDFAYAVSHDLQGPLRHISEYSKILQVAIENQDQEQIHKANKVIDDSAETLRSTIEGLLEYSRVNTRGRPLQKVELDDVLKEVELDMASSLEFHGALIDSGPLPSVQGDRDQIKSIFYHLIDNAVKYRKDALPLICISSAPHEDGFIQITVKDNGIGVDDRHTERVFTIFTRLGYKEDVPGIGVGLALVKRIVIRHGGRIWLQSNTDGGSNVCFTLQKFRQRCRSVESDQ